MAKLLLKLNSQVLKEIPFERDVLTVGRKPDNDIVIDHPAVSSHHCRVVREEKGFFVEDLDSTNGTYLNEKRVMRSLLRDQDVIGLARHALVFVEEKPLLPPDETVAMSSDELQEAAKAAAKANPHPKMKDKVGGLRVLKGIVAEVEYELKGMSTYIGKSDRVQVPIKGAGLFGGAPEVAASIHRKPEGYVLVAVQAGYPAVNGTTVKGQIVLNDGDLIDCGGTTLQFFLKDVV